MLLLQVAVILQVGVILLVGQVLLVAVTAKLSLTMQISIMKIKGTYISRSLEEGHKGLYIFIRMRMTLPKNSHLR
jgi:hypothetical protein